MGCVWDSRGGVDVRREGVLEEVASDVSTDPTNL